MKRDINYFIKKGKEVYGDLHSFEKSIYKGALKKVEVTCKKHGNFLATVSNYYRGNSGCVGCFKENFAEGRKKSAKYYLSKLNTSENEHLDFSKSIFTTTRAHIDFKCKYHGNKRSRLNNLLNGTGCNECAIEHTASLKRITSEEALKRLYKIYGDRYEFDTSRIKGYHSMIPYKCKLHGDIKTKFGTLLKGSKCIECGRMDQGGAYNTTKIEKNKEKYLTNKSNLYLLKIFNSNETFLKVGIAKRLKSRVSKIKCTSNYNVSIMDCVVSNIYDIFYKEQYILSKYKNKQHVPDSKFKGWTECLDIELQTKLIKMFNKMKKDKKFSDILK